MTLIGHNTSAKWDQKNKTDARNILITPIKLLLYRLHANPFYPRLGKTSRNNKTELSFHLARDESTVRSGHVTKNGFLTKSCNIRAIDQMVSVNT